MGVVAILFAAVPIGYNAVFLANSQVVTGTAVEFGRELTDNTKGNRPAGTSTVIEFTTTAGETVRADGGSAASSRYTDLGDRVPVRYDPGDPGHAKVDETFLFLHLTYLPLIFAALGAAALVAVAGVAGVAGVAAASRIRKSTVG
ncbi:DUF3592 domain-containing protein [Nocardia grenadensis]|uniref:DUF3592 domain-containing protein n=1 Tax=Nocardia grenadensis TaxID=931537 RepID=UPI003D9230E1